MKLRTGLSILLLIAGPVLAADKPPATKKPQALTPEQRISNLERMVRNQNMADIVLTLQRLQQEVQRLSGEVELQNHTIDTLKKQQRDLYLDLDGRISRMQKGASVVPPPVVAAPTPVATAQSAEPIVADPALEEQSYQAAFNLLKQGRYANAIVAFKTFLKSYPNGDYADNAQYWLGEASYVTRDFKQALADFDVVIQRYPDSTKVRGALLKSGYIHYEQKSWQQARRVLQQLIDSYPNSSDARLAEKRLQRMSKERH